jgi:hypothetical protein
MIKTIFCSILLFSILCHSQEESQLDTPAEDQVPISEEVSSTDTRIIHSSFGLQKGKFLFAPSTSVEVEFNSLSLGYLKIRESNLSTDFTLEHMFNSSAANFTSVKGQIGYCLTFNSIKLIPMASIGLTLYRESTPTQNIVTFGKSLSLSSKVIYNIKNDFGVLLNLDYTHLMFSHGYSPKDPSQELVYDYTTTAIGLFWEL